MPRLSESPEEMSEFYFAAMALVAEAAAKNGIDEVHSRIKEEKKMTKMEEHAERRRKKDEWK